MTEKARKQMATLRRTTRRYSASVKKKALEDRGSTERGYNRVGGKVLPCAEKACRKVRQYFPRQAILKSP